MSLLYLILLFLTSGVVADYEVEVTVHSYQNPTGRCDGCRQSGTPNPGCCDESFIRPPSQSCLAEDTCDTSVDYCIRSLGSSADGCPEDQTFFSPFAVEETNTYSMSPTFFGVDNPILITGQNEPWNGIQLFFQIQDAVLVANGFSEVVLIDSVAINIDIQVGSSSEAMLYTGNAGLTQVNVSFEVRCAENFTGWNCSMPCPNILSCSECGQAEFTGKFCQISNDCLICNYSSNLRCVLARNGSFVCDCEIGFTGEDCETQIDYCVGVTCSENGQCQNSVRSFTCLCNKGYTGLLCESEINVCESVTCSESGRCMNSQNLFVCECYEGFTGLLCESQVMMPVSTTVEDNFATDMQLQAKNHSATTTGNIYYIIISGGVGGILVLVILFALFLITLSLVIMKSKRSAEVLNVPKNGDEPEKQRTSEDQKLTYHE